MESKTFYDRIIEDVSTFDKILYDLEKMSQEAPNPRIRTVADTAIVHLKLAQQICAALQEADTSR